MRSLRARHFLGVGFAVAAWELNAHLHLYQLWAPTLPPPFFPAATEILGSLTDTLTTRAYFEDFVTTVFRTLLGFMGSGLLGVVLGLFAARIRLVDDVLLYPFEFMRQLPAVALLPFLIIAFGIGGAMKVAISFLGSIFPVFMATRSALASIDQDLLLTARSYRWSGSRLLLGVMLPAALPGILAALRIALAISLILVITGEMFVGSDGLGQRLVELERSFRYAGLYAETLLLGVVGFLLNGLFKALSRKIYFWGEAAEWAI